MFSARTKKTYYVDPLNGSDNSLGNSQTEAFKTLKKLNSVNIKSGERILLKRGCTFHGCIKLKHVRSTKENPLTVASYGDEKDPLPIISAKSLACVSVEDCSHLIIQDIEITSDGGKGWSERANKNRYGVYIHTETEKGCNDIKLERLFIHHIFANEMRKSEGKTGKTSWGHGVFISAKNNTDVGMIKNITLDSLRIENTGYYGVKTESKKDRPVENLYMLNCQTENTGCSGIQMGQTSNAVIKNNIINKSGSFIDERMHGRGSGSWTFQCNKILYEGNKFMNAKGYQDSTGVHIDHQNTNIVIQRNLSYNNEGGFIEILGDTSNCCYRYNISINDGYRHIKENKWATGKVIWITDNANIKTKEKAAALNNYIYNNTIYCKEEYHPTFAVAPGTKGLLIANNIFHIMHTNNERVTACEQKKRPKNIVFKNNLYNQENTLSHDLRIKDTYKIIGNSQFANPGGVDAKDYIPTNKLLVQNKGIEIERLNDDDIGIFTGLKMEKDYFGRCIPEVPSLGAIEV